MASRCRFVVLREGHESKQKFSQDGWKRALAAAEKQGGTVLVECDAPPKREGQATMDFTRQIEWIRLASCEGGRCRFTSEDQPHRTALAGVGAYSETHIEAAKGLIDAARGSSQLSTPGCGTALPHIMAAKEALAGAWAHLSAVPETSSMKAAKARLINERKAIEKKVAADLSSYLRRCIDSRYGK